VEDLGIVELLANLWQVVLSLLGVLANLLALTLRWSLVIVWVAWWLWGVNWRRVWPVLSVGGWIAVALLGVTAALVWSRLAPREVANFWWHLGAVGLLVALALFCGWLQGVFGWAPGEIELEPQDPDPTHGHEHPVGTLHGHDYAHADEPQ
jgi:hypothetical protein